MSALLLDYYQPGDVIYQGEPFMKVIRHDLWNRVCAYCLESVDHLKFCKACGIMKYCGKECQRKAWPDHKLECPFLPTYTDLREQPLVQMIGNIILKIDKRDWSAVTERIMNTEVSFDDLVSHTDTRNLANLIINYNLIKDPLKSYIGREKIPNEETLLEFTGKVIYNQSSFRRDNSSSPSSDSWALFMGLSMFKHSCIPNSTVVYNGKTLALRAAKAIHKKKGKITFSNCSLVACIDSPLLYKEMKKSALENCSCIDCSKPYGRSALTKILDFSNASRVIEETESILHVMALLARLQYPTGIVTRMKLKQLLQKQRGVLGNTNLLHMQTLAMKSLFMDGPKEEMKADLVELAHAMKEVWGVNFEELSLVYEKLQGISAKLRNAKEVVSYQEKISQLTSVCGALN